ncbi:MAG: tetratricopeptide repeat protein [Porphyromonas sp.]|nr:tetratricopeptide repeat protein [Porphyromonas sp.]
MKKVLTLLSALIFSLTAMAQTGVETGTPYGKGNDSIECAKNIAFYKTYAKSENYVDAYTFWKRVYDNCPGATKDTYIIGANILKYNIENAKTAEERQKWIDELMTMYDVRIKYFGDDPKTGKDYVLGNKAADYINYMGAETDYVKIYDWLVDVVNEKKENTDPLTLSYFTFASMVKMMQDDSYKEQYINEHLMVDGFYNKKIEEAMAAGNNAVAETYQSFKQTGEDNFAASGAASCEVMEKIYAPKIAEHKTDKAYLESTIALFKSVGCTESPVYFSLSENLYNIEPTAEAALGIAGKAYKEKNFDRAENYYKQAIELSDDPSAQADAYYLLAVMSYNRGNYTTARTNANKAMQLKSNFGAPLLLIAQMYAASARNIFPDDPVKQRVVYCLVVDKCERARAIDPSISAEANRLIGTYRQHFPSKEDVFMHPDLQEGGSFTVGGWIGETTTIRVSQ